MIQDKIQSANKIYYESSNITLLETATSTLEQVLRELSGMTYAGEAVTKNIAAAEALMFRIRAKILAIKYYDGELGGFCPPDGDALQAYLNETTPIAYEKNYTKTYRALAAIKTFTDNMRPEFDEVYSRFTALFSEHGDFVGSTKDAKAAIKFLTKVIERLQACEDTGNVFGENVKFIDLKSTTLREMTGARDRIQAELSRLESADAMRIFNKNVTTLDPPSPGYPEYYPVFNDRISANVIVLRTPFLDEAKLYVMSAIKTTGHRSGSVDAHTIQGANTEKLFEAFAAQSMDCLIVNLCDCTDKTQILTDAMKAGKRGQKIFIVDDNPVATVYDAAMEIAANDDSLTVLDVGCRYLTMPYLDDLVKLFKDSGMFEGTEAERELVRTTMPFMGYVGLNKVMSASIRGDDWQAVGKAASDSNLAFARAYIAELPTISQIIGSEWRAEEIVKCAGGDRGQRKPLDYDDLQGINHNNIRKILESRGSFFGKCGALARYCLLGGNDVTQWELVDVEERSRRFTLATRLIMRMLDTGLDPVVEIIPQKEWNKIYNEGFGGMCCDGGKRIQYREDCTDNFEWSVETVCHESFHSFQHHARSVGFQSWFFSELGVTKYRIDEWARNNSTYFGSEPNDSYRVQIIEADAYAFMHDCNEQGSLLWHTIDFE